jgi:transcription-repair coupling factor (superfamily II helicase)
VSKTLISQTFAQTLQLQNLRDAIAKTENRTHLKGLVGSSLSIIISEAFKSADKSFLLIFDDKEEAAYYLNDLEQLLNDKDVLFYPGSYRRPYQIEETNNANVLLRAEVFKSHQLS